MKKLFFIFSLVLFCSVKAQTYVYHPMPDSSAYWCEEWSYGASACYTIEVRTITLNGDTTINAKQYHKVYDSGNKQPASGCFPIYYFANNYLGAIRQDTTLKKVYVVRRYPNSNETTLYDFSLDVGDTLPEYPFTGPPGTVVAIDSILIGSTYRKRFKTSAFTYSNSFYIIEGIGSTVGLLLAPNQDVESSSDLKSFTQNGQTVYNPNNYQCVLNAGIIPFTKENNIVISPNPSNGSLQLSSVTEIVEIKIRNYLGEIIYEQTAASTFFKIDISQQPAGVYFVQAKTNGIIYTGKIIVQY
ncbi:MAG TPA: T9SS type A sorting domain-containing protein [Bacteroidia bacterium]|nr:T9SS type A sorting domain-containing protein [Bacteroidia bacterium]